MPGQVDLRVLGVDADGVTVAGEADPSVDVLIGGRRVWSFRPRLAEPTGDGAARRLAWPPPLRGFLHGVADVRLEAEEAVLFEQTVTFGDSGRRVEVVDREGRELIIDNSGRLAVPFGGQGGREKAALLDALREVLAALADAGVDAFPAYGTLLGAVRDGTFIGHDTDADVGYVSRFDHPVDVIRESFRLQRELVRRGYRITRHSGGGFKVHVQAPDGSVRGLDVFSGAFIDDHLLLMGELYAPFRREWLLPLGTVALDGVTLPAPAEPERLLAALYGESWRVPDPTFTFAPDPATAQRLSGWFRGTSNQRNHWDRRYSVAQFRTAGGFKGHPLARVVHEREPGATVVDVGCGLGQDVAWLAERGHRAIGLDFAGGGFLPLQRLAEERGWPAEYHEVNLLELRHTLGWGARLARPRVRRAVLARHLLDATTPRGRAHFWRLCGLLLADGGRAYVEFVTGDPAAGVDPRVLLTPLAVDEVVADAERHGGRVTETTTYRARNTGHRPASGPVSERFPACRLVVEWAP